MSIDERLSALLSRIANVQLFLICMRPTPLHDMESDEGKALLVEHLEWQFAMEEQGLLLGAGPLDYQYQPDDPPARPMVDAFGMSVIAASTREAAETVAATEPFTRRGWRETQVVSWHLNEGVGAPLARELVERTKEQ
jgi:uncharacterized protein YciI